MKRLGEVKGQKLVFNLIDLATALGSVDEAQKIYIKLKTLEKGETEEDEEGTEYGDDIDLTPFYPF